MKRGKNYLKTILVLTIALFIFSAHSTQSALIDYVSSFGLNATLSTLDGLAYLVGYIAGLFVTVGGTLVNWTLSQNAMLLTSNTVQTGFIVSRDLANLGFVLAIIIIAFATILRFEQYQMQKILWKLIVAALLVNFSLVIAGVFIDFAGILTDFFISKAASGTVGEGLADAFNVQSLLQQTEREDKIKALVQGLKEDPNKHYPFTASVIFVAIFTTIVAISLISLAAMLYIRYIWLTILLILAPLAWLMWIWPDLEHLQKKWWGKFMQWTMFGPAITFFIYLAIAVALKGGIVPVGSSLDEAIGVTIKDFGTMLAKMISVLGILYGGMYTANAMGIAGAGVGFAVAKGVKNLMVGGAVVGGAGLAAGAGLAGVGLAGATGRAYEKLRGRSLTEDLRTLTAKGSALPVVGGLMARGNQALVQGTEERMEQYKKRFSGMDEDALKGYLKRDPLLMRDEERAALMGVFAEKNKLTEAKKTLGYDAEKKTWAPGGEAKFDLFAKATVERGGAAAKAVISKDPTLAKWKVKTEGKSSTKISQEIKDEVGKALKVSSPEAWGDLNLGILQNNPEYIAEIKNNQLNKILERGVGDQQEFIQHLKDNLKTASGMPTRPPYLDKLEGVKKIIDSSPAWAFKP